MFYNTNGIPTKDAVDDKFWIQKNFDRYFFSEGDITEQLDFNCISLHHLLSERIFGNRQYYFSLLMTTHTGIIYGGIDSDIRISNIEFEKMVKNGEKDENFNKLLYYFDCRNLISTLQNSILESKYLVGRFYQLLNENDYLLNRKPIDDNGTQFAGGQVTSDIVSIVNSLFINFYSQLDFISKIIFEFERLETNFKIYPKLKSSNILYGDNKKFSIEKSGTVFESSVTINLILTLRNEIVHNASIDNLPKIYQVFKNGIIVEKYMLLPDTENGRLKTFKSRRRFFYNDNKLNELLPTLVSDFWKRLNLTLSNIE